MDGLPFAILRYGMRSDSAGQFEPLGHTPFVTVRHSGNGAGSNRTADWPMGSRGSSSSSPEPGRRSGGGRRRDGRRACSGQDTSNTSPGIGEDQHAVPCGDARREPGPAGALPVISRSRAWSGRERSPIARICSAASPRPELSLGVIVRRGNKDTRSAIRRGGQVRVGCAGGRADRGDVRGGLGWWLLLEQRTQTG